MSYPIGFFKTQSEVRAKAYVIIKFAIGGHLATALLNRPLLGRFDQLAAPTLPPQISIGPAGLAAALSAVGTLRRRIRPALQLTVIGLTLVGAAATSTLYGPLVLVPTLIATFTVVLQAHPNRPIRWATWAMGCMALIVIAVLELLRPASDLFHDGVMTILPRMLELPRTESILLLLSESLAMMIVPCLFIGKIRDALTEAQQQILVQAWQFRRFGEDLMTTRATRP